MFDVACVVTNPLVGREGASAVLATPEMVRQLDDNLRHNAEAASTTIPRSPLRC